jgi:hypothetical protein
MIGIGSQKGKLKVYGHILDADGNPKASKEAAIKLWHTFNKEQQEYLKEKYSLDLEIK